MEPIKCTKCPLGHDLVSFMTTHSEFGCDCCRRYQLDGAQMYSCREDNYDVCHRCYDKGMYMYFNSTGMTIEHKNEYKEPDACWNDVDSEIDIEDIPEDTKYFVCVPRLSSIFKNKLKNTNIHILTWREEGDNPTGWWSALYDLQQVEEFIEA